MNETDKFADTLLRWIKDALKAVGIPDNVLNQLDAVIYIVLILLISYLVGEAVHYITLYSTRRVLKYKKVKLLSSLIEYGALRKLSYIIPPLIVAALLPFAFEHDPKLLNIFEKITWIYFIIVLTVSANVILNSFGDAYLEQGQLHNRPMKGFMQILQVIFYFMAFVVVVSILINKSPFNLITGLGAFAAVLMLIFKDTILGFVAGVLISQNDIVHVGDWIEMDQFGVNGTVMDISLNIIKVQNFDNTIVTIPPYSLVSGSFINWRGMAESGGRRIMRSYDLKLDNIAPCTPEFLEEMKQIPLLTDYISRKQRQAAAGKTANTDNPDGLVNGTIETNIGLFRAYMTLYLQQHPFVSQDLLLMVRTLAPTENGLPVQIYCFSSNKNWPSYESIQAEIMEHFVYMLPKFRLYPFQNASARDYINSGVLETGTDPEGVLGLPWNTFKDGVVPVKKQIKANN